MDIFNRVVAKIKRDYPLFQVKIIVCALKIIGKSHVDAMIKATKNGSEFTNMISGFDMVNEEDATPPMIEFVKQITDAERNFNMAVVLHGKNNFCNPILNSWRKL
jgi:adenosine deaminase